MIKGVYCNVTRTNYFPILDPLRFVASICVFLAHSVVFFDMGPAFHMHFSGLIRNAGYYGVVFFYVLSGYLITYLLLVEKEKTGKIAIRDFYVRRILRIWPLYYLIVILSFFILPFVSPWKEHLPGGDFHGTQFLLYALFLPNIANYAGPYIATCFQIYTIGYEEQFYLLWPAVMRIGRKFLMPLMAILFFGHFFLELFHLYLIRLTEGQHGGAIEAVKACLTFINLSNLPAFVAGAFAALLYLDGGAVFLKRLQWKGWTYLLTAAVLYLMCFIKPGDVGLVNVVSLVFAFLILHLVLLRRALPVNLQRLLSKGGTISYGIYMFHPAIFILVSSWLQKMAITDVMWGYFFYLAVSFILVLLVSYLSYRFVEQPFLKRKQLLAPRWVGKISSETPQTIE